MTRWRLRVAALLAGAAMNAACGHESSSAHALPESPQLRALIERGEAALAAGEPETARAAFEQAAALRHTAAIEIGWVRAQMQAGEYRRALAFAAHTAGAHADEAEGAALYAWLLYLGGQVVVARATLDRAWLRLPGDTVLADAKTWVTAQTGSAQSGHAAWAHSGARFAPVPLGEAVPAGARVAGNAVLLPGGRRAVVPLALLDGSRALWLRNGLGRATQAEVLRRDDAHGLAVLQLRTPLDVPTALSLVPREAFPGSPGFVVGYDAQTSGRAAWPQLKLGFLGGPMAGAGQRRLGIAVAPGSTGAPVFDAAGRLAGIVLPPGVDGSARMGSAELFAGLLVPTPQAEGPSAHMPVDELYERALRISLQVIRGE